MKNLKYIFLMVAFLCLMFQIQVNATLKFERFSNKEGFNQNTINNIAQDQDGFLWFGTPNGLIKYDGYEFTNYTFNPVEGESVSNNEIHCLFTDKNGMLWIGNGIGVDVYIPWLEKFKQIKLPSESSIHYIDVDRNGRIWFLGRRSLFYCEVLVDNDSVRFEVSENIFSTNWQVPSLRHFYFSNDKQLLLGTVSGMYSCKLLTNSVDDKIEIKTVDKMPAFGSRSISAIKRIGNIYWIGTNNGLFKCTLEGDRVYLIQKFEQISDGVSQMNTINIVDIYEDKEGSIWCGTINQGVFKYNANIDKFEIFGYDPKDDSGISSSMINCIFQDRYNVLWLGTAEGGLNKLDLSQKQFLNYRYNPYDRRSIPGDLISAVLEDSRGYLWVACNKESICRSVEPVSDQNIRKLKFDRLRRKMPINKTKVVLTFFEDSKGYIWMGTNFSILVYNPYSDEIRTVSFEREGAKDMISRCHIINQISDNEIVFGALQRLFVVKDPWSKIKKNSDPILPVYRSVVIPNRIVESFVKDRWGKYWVGTDMGLFLYEIKNDSIQQIDAFRTVRNDSLKITNDKIFSLFDDQKNNIWVGTFGGGLNKISCNETGGVQSVKHYRKSEFLPDDVVYSFLSEDQDNVWISTDMGLCEINMETESATVYDVRDGLANNNFRKSAAFKGQSGYLYFGGLNGLTIFKPENIVANDIAPETLITGVKVNNKRVRIGEEHNGKTLLEESITNTSNITFGPGDKIISFDVLVQQTTTPGKNKLAYMLEGFDEDWVTENSGKSTITYTNLPPETYRFMLKGANGDGVWSNSQSILNIEILPPWYKTWWFYSLIIVVGFILVFSVGAYLVRMESLKHKLKFEQLAQKKSDAINQGKLRFFTNISHEFRTPLTLISGPLERSISLNQDKEIASYLTTVQNNTKRLLNLIDQLVSFRRVEQGHMDLSYSKLTIGDFVYPIVESFENLAIQKNISFNHNVKSTHESIVIDTDKMERILFNLLSNAFRHTAPNGAISIEADLLSQNAKSMFKVDVVDNGKGIQAKNIGKIFERFYRVDSSNDNSSSTGIGLAYCKSLVELMQGEIVVESEPSARTCFSVRVPCDKEVTEIPEPESLNSSLVKEMMPAEVNRDIKTTDLQEKEKFSEIVLVVDDEPEIRDFLKDVLGESYTLRLAADGSEALGIVKHEHIDLIISDVMMPKMDGYEFCKAVKTDINLCHIPVVLLTALGDAESKLKGIEFGADVYISKPFNVKFLQTRVQKLLEGKERLREFYTKFKPILGDNNVEISEKDKEFYNRTLTIISNNMSHSSFGIEELATHVGLSTSQFYRRFKQITGKAPNLFLRNYRLQKAAEIIQSHPDYNMSEVMARVGFESNSYFSSAFKKLHGKLPSEYVRSLR